MLKQKRGSRGQSLSEYVLLIAVVFAVLVGMQLYMQRGIQSVIKYNADDLGNQTQGSAEYDSEIIWKVKSPTQINITTVGESSMVAHRNAKGKVRYEENSTTIQKGTTFHGVYQEKE